MVCYEPFASQPGELAMGPDELDEVSDLVSQLAACSTILINPSQSNESESRVRLLPRPCIVVPANRSILHSKTRQRFLSLPMVSISKAHPCGWMHGQWPGRATWSLKRHIERKLCISKGRLTGLLSIERTCRSPLLLPCLLLQSNPECNTNIRSIRTWFV